MKAVFKIIYSFLILPLLAALFHAAGLFNKKVRKALLKRYHILAEIKRWYLEDSKKKNVVLLHSSSMGEFEHIKPLIQRLKKNYNPKIIVTFFSPSGYENVKSYPGVNLFLYSPIDFVFVWKKIYKLLKPSLVIISKHDVWPNQIWTAEKMSIPVYLVNASLSKKSSRGRPAVRFFLRYVYRSLTNIYAVSKEDETRFKEFFPKCSVSFAGDTKFDQVLIRKEMSADKKLLPKSWFKNSFVLLLGSVWPEDTKHLLPAMNGLLERNIDLKIILVPHDPNEKYIEELYQHFEHGSAALFTKNEPLKEQHVLIVDTIGILADLYKYADAAYVGGSFKQGIHNVMEPAVYGIPVLYGPHHKNSFEAVQLNQAGGGIVVTNHDEITQVLSDLIDDSQKTDEAGRKAEEYTRQHCGATDKLAAFWKADFKQADAESAV